MPRQPGQVDLSKTDAILEAAAALFFVRGLSTPIDEIARRACVSKQTIYNRYGSKAELVRAMVAQRVEATTAPLNEPGALEHPEEALADYARSILEGYTSGNSIAMLRVTVEAAAEMPDVARAVHEAGPKTSRAVLARFLKAEHVAGRLRIDDAERAASFFAGMVIGSRQLDGLLGFPTYLTDADIDVLAREVAARFLKAYAP